MFFLKWHNERNIDIKLNKITLYNTSMMEYTCVLSINTDSIIIIVHFIKSQAVKTITSFRYVIVYFQNTAFHPTWP